MLECGDPQCDICGLSPQPGETQEQWKARLKDRFACNPLPPVENPIYTRASAVCQRCGAPRTFNAGCTNCRRNRTT